MSISLPIVALVAACITSSGAWAAGLVWSVSGKASVQRGTTTTSIPLTVGAQLNEGDIVRLDPGASAEIDCGAPPRLKLTEAVQVFACNTARSLFSWNGKDLPNPRAPARVLLPAGTLVLNPRPSIRWTTAQIGQHVRVIVRGRGFNWDRVVGNTGRLIYPADAPALVRGQVYRVLVLEPDADPETASGSLNSGFKVLSEEQAQEATRFFQELDSRQGLSLVESAQLKVRARLLAGLNAEAIETAERASQDASLSSAMDPLLGAAWLRTGCTSCALPILERAVGAADAGGDTGTFKESGRLLADAYRQVSRSGDAERLEKRLRAHSP